MQRADLASLRQEIDRIDDTIADLLMERLGVVRAVGHAKGDLKSNRLALRLSREAQMMRRLLTSGTSCSRNWPNTRRTSVAFMP